jgi:hypothetical protein
MKETSSFKSIWTKEKILDLLERNPKAVERAIVRIYERQTEDEKAGQNTKHLNGMGFSGAHAAQGTYYAKWVLSGRRLTGAHLEKARNIAKRYAGQLLEIAKR